MEATGKLYDHDPYGKTFTAQVTDVQKKADKWLIVLDQTLFFPEEGGQFSDTGWLSVATDDSAGKTTDDQIQKETACPVTDVQIRDGVIYHEVKGAVMDFAPGMTVRGEIDWESRFSNMQNHTGEHIISGLIHAKYGFDNVGFHLSRNIVTLDQSGYLTPEELVEIEKEANRVVWANLPVTAEYFSPEEAGKKSYRSKIEIEGPVRLVTIGEVDVCACCAPHVMRTGEIGLIKILRSEKYKGGTRITFLCGDRALEEVEKRQDQIEKISRLLRAKQDETFEAVGHLYEENAAQKERLIRIQAEKIRYLAGAAECVTETEQIIRSGSDIWIFTSDLDPLPHRNLVNMLVEQCEGFAGVFLLQEEQNYRFIIGSRMKDCREASAFLKEKLDAKGGGKPEMIQGSVVADNRETIKAALDQL